MQIHNNGISQYGDTFLEGVSHNQHKSDERLVKAIKRAQHFEENPQMIRGMILALKVLRGEPYDKKTLDMSKPVTEKIKD